MLNNEAVDLAIVAALGLGCQVHEVSIFARKSYFYPDLPKGYQITQFEDPLATEGVVSVESVDVVSPQPVPKDTATRNVTNSDQKDRLVFVGTITPSFCKSWVRMHSVA